MRLSSTHCLLLTAAAAEAFPSLEIREDCPDTEALDWQPCALDFPESVQQSIQVPVDCATLQVPLDYTDSTSEKTLKLQLIKVNATKEPVQGSVIFNPGGPGSSGIEEVATKGPLYQETLGGHFNVIGFDARGTGRTMPFNCHPPTSNSTTTVTRRNTANSALPEQLDVSDFLNLTWNTTSEYIKGCAAQKENATFYGTAFVARDMLAIVDALNEDGLLRFWGRSYSTVLGQTFAAMFPDRVGRLLLDSVLLADDYYSGGWVSATRDTEATLSNAFDQCIKAGPELCPLANYTGQDTTPETLMEAFSEVLQELIDDPVYLAEEVQAGQPEWWFPPGAMSVYYKLKATLLALVYYPRTLPSAAAFVSIALSRNWTAFTEPSTLPPAEPSWSTSVDGFYAIGCGDSIFRAESPEEMYSLAQAQQAQGSFADGFAAKVWTCAQWPFEAAERYSGGFHQIRTKFPILLANSRHDPITPLSGAWDASSRFVGSRLLVHEGHGHGVMNHRSNCTVEVIRKYFADGELPKNGATCEPNMNAFEQGALELSAPEPAP